MIVIECSIPDLPRTGTPARRRRCPDGGARGGLPGRAVGVGVVVVADPEVAEVEQADGNGRRAFQRHPVPGKVTADPAPGPRQVDGGRGHSVELRLVAVLPPGRVVQVLAPAGSVPRRLLVAVRDRADPDVAPGRRDGQRPDPFDIRGRQWTAIGVQVAEAAAGTASRPARRARRDPAQSRDCGSGTRTSGSDALTRRDRADLAYTDEPRTVESDRLSNRGGPSAAPRG